MSLKKSKGNMYLWVTDMHSLLAGECSHKCSYCYVDSPISGRPEKYCGPIRLLENELDVNYGEGKVIFIEHMNDLFAKDVPKEIIDIVIEHCLKFPNNTYVFQTKNPARFLEKGIIFPENCIFGTTIETNRPLGDLSKAPDPEERMKAMVKVKGRKFVTIEPVLDFDVDILAKWIKDIDPEFLNLGADSKDHHLPEPTVEKIMELVAKLKEYGIELREKHNLKRLTERAEKNKNE